MFIKLLLILIIITILCILIIITTRLSCNCIDKMENIPIYLDKPTKLIEIYFPYIDINYINNKLIKPINNSLNKKPQATTTALELELSTFDAWIQNIPDYENEMFNILKDQKYNTIYKAIFDIKPQYEELFNIFNAYVINRQNSTFIKDTDVQNKYIIKKLYNDYDYLYIVPFTEKILNPLELPIISDFNMIDTVCKKNNKYIQCKIKIKPEPKNFQIIEDKYYQDIVDYYTSLFFVDIIKKIPIKEKCNIIIPMEENRQAIFRDRLKTTFINILPQIETPPTISTTCNCIKS